MARSAHRALETSGSDGVAVVQMNATQSIAFRKHMVVVQDEATTIRLWDTLYELGNGLCVGIGLADMYPIERLVQQPDDKEASPGTKPGKVMAMRSMISL